MLCSAGHPAQCPVMPRGARREWGSGREVQEAGNIPIHTAHLLQCTAEANTTL